MSAENLPDASGGPCVSVVIPTYNRRADLRRALGSVFGQTMAAFEVIVVDDGSTDDTAQMLASIDDPRLRVVRHDRNLGAAAARNTGVEASRAPYIAFLDSDDEWLPAKLDRQVALLAAASPASAGCCTRYFVADGNDGASWRRMLPLRYDWRRYLVTDGCNLGPGSTLMVRRDVFDTVGMFDPGLRRYEDWDWLLRYLSRYELAIAPETLAVVHLSGVPSADEVAHAMQVLMPRWAETARSFGPVAERKCRARFRLELAKSEIVEGRAARGFGNIVRALCVWPFQRPGSCLSLFRYITGRRRRLVGLIPRGWNEPG